MFKIRKLRRLFTGLSFLMAIAMLGILTLPMEAHAGSFTHKHTDACYVTKTKTCSKHHIRTDKNTINLHCFTCGTFQTFDQTIYWDCCDNALEPNHDVAYQQRCPVCGTYRRNEVPTTTRSHTYTARELSCGMADGAEEAGVSLTADTGSWTNDGVVLSAGVNIKSSKFSLAADPYSFSGGSPVSDSSVKVTENGDYTVTVTGSDGRTASASVNVSNIDKAAPIVSLVNLTAGYSESGVDLQVSFSDDASGVNEGSVSFNGGAASNATTLHVSRNGTYTVSVSDNAGNVGTASIEVTNACKDPAVVAAEMAAAEKAAAEKAAAEKAAAEKAAAEKAAAEKAAAEKAAAEKAAQDKNKTSAVQGAANTKSGGKVKTGANAVSLGDTKKNGDTKTTGSDEKKSPGLFESISIIKKNAKNSDWKESIDPTSVDKTSSELTIAGDVTEVVTLGMADVTRGRDNADNALKDHTLDIVLLTAGSLIALISVIFGIMIIRKTKSR